MFAASAAPCLKLFFNVTIVDNHCAEHAGMIEDK
jgi:hypothetical protein